MTTYYGGLGSDGIQALEWSATSTPGAETLYIWILRLCRAESDLITNAGAKTITYDPINPNISITLNPGLRASGEQLFEILVAFSNAPSASSAIVVGGWRALENNQIAARSLPVTLNFNSPELVSRTVGEIEVADFAALAVIATKIHGMVRIVDNPPSPHPPGQAFRWDAEISEWIPWKSASGYNFAPRKTAVNVDPLAANPDYFWFPNRYPSQPGDSPVYAENSPSCPVVFWLVNDGLASWEPGAIINLANQIGNNPDLGELLSGLVKVKVLGLVDASTGEIDTSPASTPNVNVVYTWDVSAGLLFLLEGAVPEGFGLVVELFFQFYKSQLPAPSDYLRSIPINQGKYARYLPGFEQFGDYLSPPFMLVVPDPSGVSHTGGGAKIGSWLSPTLQPGEGISSVNSYLLGLTDGEAQIVYDAQANRWRAEPINTLIEGGQFRRDGIVCNVFQAPGVSQSSAISTLAGTATGAIKITFAHPNTISLDYPIINGLSAINNAPMVYVYLTISGTIYQYEAPSLNSGSQEIIIADFGAVVGSIPPGDFLNDLFAPPVPNLSQHSGAGNLPTGTAIACALKYAYPSPNQAISVVEHGLAGMLPILTEVGAIPGLIEGGRGLTPEQLEALPSANFTNANWGRLIVAGENVSFYFNPASLAAPNGSNVFKPDDRDLAVPGRYLVGAGVTDIDSIHLNVSGEIAGLALKDPPEANDIFIIESPANGNAKRKVVFSALGGGGGGADPNALHLNTSGEILTLLEKFPIFGPSDYYGDLIIVEDNANSYEKVAVNLQNIMGVQVLTSVHPGILVDAGNPSETILSFEPIKDYEVNTLTSNLFLFERTNAAYQFLNPNGGSRGVEIGPASFIDDGIFWQIKCTGTGSLNIVEEIGDAPLVTLSNTAGQPKAVQLINLGGVWDITVIERNP